jgi:uncharacterized protein (DUF849 family)
MKPVLIMVAPTGARRSKLDHPQLPMTAPEIGRTARACADAGAGAIHVHVRDADGRHTLDTGLYREADAHIRALCADELAIQVTSESAGVFDYDVQDGLVRSLRPDAISIAPRELFAQRTDQALHTLQWAREAGVAVQFILYDQKDVNEFAAMVKSRQLPQWNELQILLVVGRYGDQGDSTRQAFSDLYAGFEQSGLASSSVWSVCAFGKGEMACLEMAMTRGGHIRVGFENSIVDCDGNIARDNADQVAKAAAMASRLGRPLLKGKEARALLGIVRP